MNNASRIIHKCPRVINYLFIIWLVVKVAEYMWHRNIHQFNIVEWKNHWMNICIELILQSHRIALFMLILFAYRTLLTVFHCRLKWFGCVYLYRTDGWQMKPPPNATQFNKQPFELLKWFDRQKWNSTVYFIYLFWNAINCIPHMLNKLNVGFQLVEIKAARTFNGKHLNQCMKRWSVFFFNLKLFLVIRKLDKSFENHSNVLFVAVIHKIQITHMNLKINWHHLDALIRISIWTWSGLKLMEGQNVKF